MRDEGRRPTIDSTKEESMEVAFWAVVAIVFVVGVLTTVAFGTFRLFGGGHGHQH